MPEILRDIDMADRMSNDDQNKNTSLEQTSMEAFWGKPISVYTRAMALTDGVLVDLTETAKEFGFKIPFACTEAVWNTVEWSEEGKHRVSGQCTEGRVHDVLTLARMAANGAAQAGLSVLEFDVLIVPSEGTDITARSFRLRLVVSGGDDGEPVWTLMFPGED